MFVAPPHQRLREPESQGCEHHHSGICFLSITKLQFGNKAYLALVIIDGASNLLGATFTSLKGPETLGAFRQWTEEKLSEIKHFSPIKSWHITSSMGLLTPYPCGPRTPWPNRAETAVRLFKRTWSIMAQALADEGYAEKVTVRQAVKKVAWARNCQLTVSDYSPLEIATGRRPPDLFDVETSTPEQLSANPSDEDCTPYYFGVAAYCHESSSGAPTIARSQKGSRSTGHAVGRSLSEGRSCVCLAQG